MLKYYLIAIEKGSKDAFHILLKYCMKNDDKNTLDDLFNRAQIAITKGKKNIIVAAAEYNGNLGNYPEMVKLYETAIELGDVDAMINLGKYYQYIEKDSELMGQCYVLAGRKGDGRAMVCMGDYYRESDSFEDMKVCYFKAIFMNCMEGAIKFAEYYKDKDINEMKKYLLLAIEKENSEAMYQLAMYYFDEKNIEEGKKYLMMACEKNHVEALYFMANLMRDDEKFEEMLIFYEKASNFDHEKSILEKIE